jgi:hypothetical protein
VTERTVTEQQVIDALKKRLSFKDTVSSLFPELPKPGELVDVSDTLAPMPYGNWRPFHHIDNEGRVFVGPASLVGWKHYRRQTPTQKGE